MTVSWYPLLAEKKGGEKRGEHIWVNLARRPPSPHVISHKTRGEGGGGGEEKKKRKISAEFSTLQLEDLESPPLFSRIGGGRMFAAGSADGNLAVLVMSRAAHAEGRGGREGEFPF